MIRIVHGCVKKFLLLGKEGDNSGEEDPFADVDELGAFNEPEEDK